MKKALCPRSSLCLALFAFGVGCAEKEDDEDLSVDEKLTRPDATDDYNPDNLDPGEFESCAAIWSLATSAPTGIEVDATAEPAIYGRLVGGPTLTEAETCDGEFNVLLAIDSNPDPAVTDWSHLPAEIDWTWEGDRTWRVDVKPGRGLAADAIYAVEVELRMEGELPYGLIWKWETAP